MPVENQLQYNRNYRPIACPTCPASNPTFFQAYASDQMLEDFEAEHIGDLTDDDLRYNQRPDHCWVEGRCLECNGADDGNCGDGEDFHD
jgi:hypothetical protein